MEHDLKRLELGYEDEGFYKFRLQLGQADAAAAVEEAKQVAVVQQEFEELQNTGTCGWCCQAAPESCLTPKPHVFGSCVRQVLPGLAHLNAMVLSPTSAWSCDSQYPTVCSVYRLRVHIWLTESAATFHLRAVSTRSSSCPTLPQLHVCT